MGQVGDLCLQKHEQLASSESRGMHTPLSVAAFGGRGGRGKSQGKGRGAGGGILEREVGRTTLTGVSESVKDFDLL